MRPIRTGAYIVDTVVHHDAQLMRSLVKH